MALQLKTIATFATAAEAHIAGNVLGGEGIAAYLDSTNVAGALGLSGSAMCEVKLQVAEADQERARRLLAQETTIAQDAAGSVRVCPKCGAEAPSGFEVCWSCQWPLNGDEEAVNAPIPNP